MAQYSFGNGSIWGTNSAANSTPVRLGALQDVTVDFSFNTKMLHGSYQFPLAIGRGLGKVDCKASYGQFFARAFNDLFFNEAAAPASSSILVADNESGSVPGSSTYTITVANSANFVEDLGVIYANTGLPLTKVASGPAAGQYSVSAGVYTFAAGDASASVKLSYTYSASGSGKTITGANQLLGQQPFFSCILTSTFNSKALYLKLNKCVSSKLSFPFKLEDFTINDFEFSAFADDSNNVFTLSTAE